MINYFVYLFLLLGSMIINHQEGLYMSKNLSHLLKVEIRALSDRLGLTTFEVRVKMSLTLNISKHRIFL